MTYFDRRVKKEPLQSVAPAFNFARVMKFNPNHDELGRFASGGSDAKLSGDAKSSLKSMFKSIAEPDGGFTYQPETKESPSSGFAVSRYPERSAVFKAGEMKPKDVIAYYIKNRDVFNQHDHFMGAWHDPDTHNVFLDVSVVKKNAADAEALCRQHDQIAYFDLSSFKSVTVNKDAKSGVLKGQDEEAKASIGTANQSGRRTEVTDGPVHVDYRQGADERGIGGSQGDAFSRILKFNPFHDELGRFASGDGANFISTGDKFKSTIDRLRGGPKSAAPNVKPSADTRKYHQLDDERAAKLAAPVLASLTPTEKGAVSGYTGYGSSGFPGYTDINETLRADASVSMSVPVATSISKIDKVLDRSTIGQDAITYRGLGKEPAAPFHAALEKGDLDSMIGTTMHDAGYQSASLKQTIASHFANAQLVNGEYPRFVMRIETPAEQHGLYVEPITHIQGEQEFLFPRNQGFVVTGITAPNKSSYTNSDTYLVHVKPIAPKS